MVQRDTRISELEAEVAMLRDLLLSASPYVTMAIVNSASSGEGAYEAELADADQDLLHRIHAALTTNTGG